VLGQAPLGQQPPHRLQGRGLAQVPRGVRRPGVVVERGGALGRERRGVMGVMWRVMGMVRVSRIVWVLRVSRWSVTHCSVVHGTVGM
jgi:hypothetical protein